MSKARFDIAGELDLEFRIARAGSILLTFVDIDGAPFVLDDYDHELNIRENALDEENIITLTDGDGLTYDSNTILVEVDEEETNLPEKLYYWELYETTTKKTWLCRNAYFISRDPSNTSGEITATVNTGTTEITVTISAAIIEGGSESTTLYFDPETIDGDGTEETPYTVRADIYESAGAAEVVAKEGLLREWDNTENKFPDSGGSGTDGAIESHNRFVGVGVGNWEILTGHGSEQVVDGMEFIAKIDAPGQTPANWWVKG
jgi:hypothetical protein